MFYINTSYLFMNLILIFSIRSFCFDTTRLVQVYVRMRRLDSLGWFPQNRRIFSRGWNASLNCWKRKRGEKKKKKSVQLRARTSSTDRRCGWRRFAVDRSKSSVEAPTPRKLFIVHSLFFPHSFVVPDADLSTAKAKKKKKAKAVKAYVAVGLVQG